jgi:hypothetical protein
MILDYAGHFIDMESRDRWGDTHLIHLARNISSGYDALRFSLLLTRGADISARDHKGQTCLHVCVKTAKMAEFHLLQELESIVLLIQRGADIHSIDFKGRSIFDDAYSNTTEDDYLNLGTYRGDLWDAALSRCGYDVRKIRNCFHRIPRYTERYNRGHFEQLWKGKEESCPYFDDPAVWCSHKTEVDDEGIDDGRRQGDQGTEDERIDGDEGLNDDEEMEDLETGCEGIEEDAAQILHENM